MSGPSLKVEKIFYEESKVSPVESHSSRPIWNDQISRSVAEITQEQLWNGLSSLYDSNEDLKAEAASLDPTSRDPNARDNGELLDGLLDTFINGANKVLDELTIIGNAHPILAIAIYAFHEVIKLDIARRENNKKVLVVVLEMQNMLGPMFQLRNLDHNHMPQREKEIHEKRLKEIVEQITQDIKVCRSDITHFINRKFVYKLVLAKGYERKFAGHIETFLRRRNELQTVISEYTAIGISSANVALAEIGKKVEVADEKLDKIAEVLFRGLDTPREKDVFKFMQQHGGPEKCVNDLDLLPKLILKAGESTKPGKVTVTNRAELEEIRKELSEALSEDLDKVLDKHFLRFEKVLQVQNNNMKRMASHLENQGAMMQTQASQLGQILDTVTTIMVMEEGKYRAKAVKLKDPEIQRVWTQMNLTSVVKAKVFVLTFRDHIRLDHSSAPTPSIGTPIPYTSQLPEEHVNSLLRTPISVTSSVYRPPLKMTESNRDLHTLQLAMNSIDAQESSASQRLPLHSENGRVITNDTPSVNVKERSQNGPEMPTPALGLTISDTTELQPLAAMPEPQIHPHLEPTQKPSLPVNTGNKSDDWVLEYIDAAYVKPIVEAMDEDGSGFISVQEANRFALARPAGMSLLHWMAYWAAGWHINLAKYQKEIYTVLLQISDIVPRVLVTNSIYVDDYLDVPILTRLDALLRSIRPVPDNVRKDHNLIEVANIMASLQMERLRTNLADMGHVIESSLDATTIAGGSSRVETWILPLVLLLLQRHRDVLRLAKTVVLDPREFDAHVQSLMSVFSVFDERIEYLEARFRQLHSDIDAQFHNFAYGMFFAAYKKDEFNTYDHTLLSKVRELWRPDDVPNKPGVLPDTSILTKPIGETFNPDDPIIDATAPLPDGYVSHPIEGEWSGWFQPSEGTPYYLRPHRCVIHPIVDNKLVGRAEAFCGAVDIHGTAERVQTQPSSADLRVEFYFSPENSRYGQQLCRGTYNAEKDIIEGTYTWFWPSTPVQLGVAPQPFFNGSDMEGAPAVGVSMDENLEAGVNTLVRPPPSNDFTPLLDTEPSQDVQTLEFNQVETILQVKSPLVNVDGGNHDRSYTGLEVGPPVTFDPQTAISEDRIDGRFVLSRIPIHLLRFRYLLDGSGVPPCWRVWPLARKRWSFAIEAILHQTRWRINSSKVFNQALAERRKWIYLSMRWYIANPDPARGGWSPFEPLSRNDWEAYETLESYVPPTNARLYERTAHYLARREVHIMPVGRLPCDVCNWDLCFRRQQCIYCKDDHLLLDHRDVDICYNCIDKPVPFREVTHSKSHSLLRSPYRIHKYEYKNVIAEARFISARVKNMFRAQEEQRNELNKHHHRRGGRGKKGKLGNDTDRKTSSTDSDPIYCACCAETVSLPCWVCIVCSPYVFFCSRCERNNASVTNWAAFYHSKKEHQILRIFDTVEVKVFRDGNNVGVQLEEINTTISSLEKKINKQLQEGKETKGVVDEMAKKVGISWSDEHSNLQSFAEGAESSSYDHGIAADSARITGISTPTDVEGTTTQPLESLHERITGNGVNQSELERRLEILEAKLGTSKSKHEKDIGVKIDALEAKMDELFILVQRLVSFTLIFLMLGAGIMVYNRRQTFYHIKV
uniref:EF-hand domain-containing protein n=1 Tax=Psilocybe cubensis TaxID=181762 RepID=A0A8H7XPD5_PSICU